MNSTAWKLLIALAIICTFCVQASVAMGSTPELRQAQIDQATGQLDRFKKMAEAARARRLH